MSHWAAWWIRFVMTHNCRWRKIRSLDKFEEIHAVQTGRTQQCWRCKAKKGQGKWRYNNNSSSKFFRDRFPGENTHPPHIHCVATLPCETKKHSLNLAALSVGLRLIAVDVQLSHLVGHRDDYVTKTHVVVVVSVVRHGPADSHQENMLHVAERSCN